jgi:hypothetical protein
MKVFAYRKRVFNYLTSKKRHSILQVKFEKFKDVYYQYLTESLKWKRAMDHYEFAIYTKVIRVLFFYRMRKG